MNTLAGVAQAPSEPGARCTLWAPWEAPWPWKLCRFITPAKPLPLEIPVTSAFMPGANRSATPMRWPILNSDTSSTRTSTRCLVGVTLALAKWPAWGRLTCLAFISLKATWMAE